MEMVKKQSHEHGTVIITDDQTNGRGQMGNIWEAEPGQNLTFSVIYKTDFIDASSQFILNMAVSVAIHKTLTAFLDKVFIKWPNDILSDGKKVGGILIENTVQGKNLNYSVIGIGINVNQRKFNSPTASSLSSLMEQDFDLDTVLDKLLTELDRKVMELSDPSNMQVIRFLYLKNLYNRGILSHFQSANLTQGTIKGVDEMGRLMVESNGEIYYFNNKEIRFIF